MSRAIGANLQAVFWAVGPHHAFEPEAVCERGVCKGVYPICPNRDSSYLGQTVLCD